MAKRRKKCICTFREILKVTRRTAIGASIPTEVYEELLKNSEKKKSVKKSVIKANKRGIRKKS